VSKWKAPYREGIVYYLCVGTVRGVPLWNVWDNIEQARKVISEGHMLTAAERQAATPV
jgi:hypothetical protein